MNKIQKWIDIIRKKKHKVISKDFEADIAEIITSVQEYTMTSPARVAAFVDAIDYIEKNKITGAIVECGVWRGGSSMAAMYRLVKKWEVNRDFFLYDTYAGMSEPTTVDVSHQGVSAEKLMKESKDPAGVWCIAGLEDVTKNVRLTGYPLEKIQFIQGKVEETIPQVIPDQIAILRLDTDWYESTQHELKHLFPRLHPQGVLIVDDYGYWQGARKAVDEFLAQLSGKYYMARIDQTGRLILRLGE
jgi:hypothetical protein